MNRLYPITKFSKTSTLEEQLEHIREEFLEAMKAAGLGERDEELADLEHSIQTYFDIRTAKGVDIDLVRQRVVEKNKIRNYYNSGHNKESSPAHGGAQDKKLIEGCTVGESNLPRNSKTP